MVENTVLGKIRDEGKSFLKAVSCASETAYLILLSLYVTIYFLLKFGWAVHMYRIDEYIRYSLLGIVMWGSAIYLFYVIASWRSMWDRNPELIATAVMILAATWLFSKKMSTNLYGVIMDIFFCVMACGKDYRKMLRCILAVAVVMLVIAGMGLPLGYTWDMVKPHNVSPGHSLGINYPNTWGYLAFLAMMITWYLYLRFRPLLTSAFFWGVSAFMYRFISCRTISLLGVVFPVLAFVVDLIEKKVKGRSAKKQGSFAGRAAVFLVTMMPFGAFAFMMAVSMQYKWLHKHYYYTWFHNFAMRFVQGGLYFKTYGLPLVGNPYRSSRITYINVNGEFLEVGILDSSFASYLIMRGILWIMYTLAWLCAAIWKALKNRDYAIPFLEFIILVFAMMERPGLEMWYNFILLYPLAKVVGGPAAAAAQDENSADKTEDSIGTDASGSGESGSCTTE